MKDDLRFILAFWPMLLLEILGAIGEAAEKSARRIERWAGL